MGFLMATPFKHPKTGIFWFRRATPRDIMQGRERLRVLGIEVPRETLRSLKTRDPGEAQKLWCEANVACMAEWDALRTLLREGLARLSQKDVFALSTKIIAGVLDNREANPGDPGRLARMLNGAKQVAAGPRSDEFAEFREILRAILPSVAGVAAIDAESLDRLTRQFLADAPSGLDEMHGRAAQGNYRKGAWREGRPEYEPSERERKILTFDMLLAGWKRERSPAPATVQAYEDRIAEFVQLLGHNDAARVTPDDVQRWKGEMVGANPRLSDKTINNKLGVISAVLGWAKENRLLPINAAAEIAKVRLKKGSPKPRRGYTDDEARKVLLAARHEAGIRRWGPWLCAFTGARIGEVARLRKEDVRPDPECKSGWLIEFTTAAGRLKTGSSERTIPAHPVLVTEGLPRFVEACEGERLFPELYGPRRNGDAPGTDDVAQRATNAISRWVKSGKVGVSDARLAPSHAWRHAFKTWCRNAGVDQECRDAIQGHVTAGVAPDYGEWTVKAMRKQMARIKSLLD